MAVLAVSGWWAVERGVLPTPDVLVERVLHRPPIAREASWTEQQQQDSRKNIAAVCADGQFRQRLLQAAELSRDLELRITPVKQRLAKIDQIILPVREQAIGRVLLFLGGFGGITASISELHALSESLCRDAAGIADHCRRLDKSLSAYHPDAGAANLAAIAREADDLSTRMGSLREHASSCGATLTKVGSGTNRLAGLLDGRHQSVADGIRSVSGPLQVFNEYLGEVCQQLARDHENLMVLASDASLLAGSSHP